MKNNANLSVKQSVFLPRNPWYSEHNFERKIYPKALGPRPHFCLNRFPHQFLYPPARDDVILQGSAAANKKSGGAAYPRTLPLSAFDLRPQTFDLAANDALSRNFDSLTTMYQRSLHSFPSFFCLVTYTCRIPPIKMTSGGTTPLRHALFSLRPAPMTHYTVSGR